MTLKSDRFVRMEQAVPRSPGWPVVTRQSKYLRQRAQVRLLFRSWTRIAVAAALMGLLSAPLNLAVADTFDFNGDGVIGVADLYLLEDEVFAGGNNLAFDVDGDGSITLNDRRVFLDDELNATAGDSNWDGVFDSADLVQNLQVGGIGRAATWATGDWSGDQLFGSEDIFAFWMANEYGRPPKREEPFPDLPDPHQPDTTDPVRFVAGTGPSTVNAITLIYDPGNGDVAVDSGSVNQMSTLEVRSESGIFTGARPTQVASTFDVFTPEKLFLWIDAGLPSTDFGPAAAPSLDGSFLMQDLLVNGSLIGGGDLASAGGGGPYLWVVSEVTPGDFDGNSVLDVADVNLLNREIAAGSHGAEFDLDSDQMVDGDDLRVWVKDLKNTWVGDANLDGEFSNEDMVAVFQLGNYELDMDAGWAEGDWTGDRRFSSEDMVAAFQDGGYELGSRAAVSAVPEPSCAILLGIGAICLCRLRHPRPWPTSKPTTPANRPAP